MSSKYARIFHFNYEEEISTFWKRKVSFSPEIIKFSDIRRKPVGGTGITRDPYNVASSYDYRD